MIAEEEAAAGLDARPCADYWLVDPLDGTREFAAGRDEFTVNIGLVRHGAPCWARSACRRWASCSAASSGRGAWKRTGAGEQPIAARTPPPDGLTVLASRHYARTSRLRAFLAGRTVATVTNSAPR